MLSRSRFLAITFPAALAAGCSHHDHTRATPAPPALGVMTFNLRFANGYDDKRGLGWNERRELALDVIRAADPDLLGVQEALASQLDDLTGGLHGYASVGAGREDGARKGEFSAIVYRSSRLFPVASGTFWFSDTPEVPGSKSWGNEIPRICTWARFHDLATGRDFDAFNVHLDHQSEPSRVKSAELLAARIAARGNGDRVLVTGDFNSGPDTPAMQRLTGTDAPALVDAFLGLHPASCCPGTFHDFTGDPCGRRIDFILTSKDWKPVFADVPHDARERLWPSDHFPVVARIL